MRTNHPKTDPSTGLNWWGKLLQRESQAYHFNGDDYEDYFEDYGNFQDLQSQRRQARPRISQIPTDKDIPGTDAWIAAQAERKRVQKAGKGVAKTREYGTIETKSQNAAAKNSRADYTHAPERQCQEPVENDKEELSWFFRLHKENSAVVIEPPKRATMKDWIAILDMFSDLREAKTLYEALYARKEYLLDKLALNDNRQDVPREISQPVTIRLSFAEFILFRNFLEAQDRYAGH